VKLYIHDIKIAATRNLCISLVKCYVLHKEIS